MTSAAFEELLARIYTDPNARERFLENPRAEALGAGLSEVEAAALERIDRDGLVMAARSLEAKRRGRSGN